MRRILSDRYQAKILGKKDVSLAQAQLGTCGLRLPPELAQLQRLEELLLGLSFPLLGGIPVEWLAPGTFPNLKW